MCLTRGVQTKGEHGEEDDGKGGKSWSHSMAGFIMCIIQSNIRLNAGIKRYIQYIGISTGR